MDRYRSRTTTMKTTFFLHACGPQGTIKTLARCFSMSDARDKLQRHEVPKDVRRWIGEYRSGRLVASHEL